MPKELSIGALSKQFPFRLMDGIIPAALRTDSGELAELRGGKEKLGAISKQGDRYLRKLLVVGATSLSRVI